MVIRPPRHLPFHARGIPGAIGLALAIVALWTRLLIPVFPSNAAGAAAGNDAAALFGEHALCLAAAGDTPVPADPQPASPATHDGAACCPLSMAVGFILPPNPPTVSVAWVALVVERLAYDTPVISRHDASILGARAPPLIA